MHKGFDYCARLLFFNSYSIGWARSYTRHAFDTVFHTISLRLFVIVVLMHLHHVEDVYGANINTNCIAVTFVNINKYFNQNYYTLIPMQMRARVLKSLHFMKQYSVLCA